MSDGILSGLRIQEMVASGDIDIDPYRPEHINPASIDLLLGDKYALYDALPDNKVMDVRRPQPVTVHRISVKEGLLLQPNTLYLMHTVERVCTHRFVPILDGKSSIGRLGIVVHLTAGYGDPGFDGQYTLEVTVVHQVRVYPLMRFCQMRFHTMKGTAVDYGERGNYVRSDSMGPVGSMAWKQFLT